MVPTVKLRISTFTSGFYSEIHRNFFIGYLSKSRKKNIKKLKLPNNIKNINSIQLVYSILVVAI